MSKKQKPANEYDSLIKEHKRITVEIEELKLDKQKAFNDQLSIFVNFPEKIVEAHNKGVKEEEIAHLIYLKEKQRFDIEKNLCELEHNKNLKALSPTEKGGWRQRIREWGRRNSDNIVTGIIVAVVGGLIVALIVYYLF